MKVIYFNYLFDKCYSSVGAAVHVEEFVDAMRANGINIKPFDLNRFDSEEAAQRSRVRSWLKGRVSKYVGQLNALLANVRYFRKQWGIVSEFSPQVLLVRADPLNISAALVARLRKIPMVLEVNSPMTFESREFDKSSITLPFFPQWTEKLNLQFADKVYTVSTALKEYFVGCGINAQKISVVPNGVDIDKFHPGLSGMNIRKKYNFQDKIVIGFVGSFHYWHGVDFFQHNVENLTKEYPNITFLLVGDGPLRGDLQKEIERNGFQESVTFTGYVKHNDIPTYLAAMDIVLAPYPSLPFFYFSPLKLFEYMAAGKAVLASRIGQIDEIVKDGVNGMLFEPGNLEEFMSKCRRLIGDIELRNRIGLQARATVCQKYSWKQSAEKVIEIMSEIVNQ